MFPHGNLPRHVVVLAFEGPDPYATVGGLSVRVTEISRALAERGHSVDLIFVGDPRLPESEERGNLTLHRACRRISDSHPRDVYDGEVEKIDGYAHDVPRLVTGMVRAAAERGERVLVLSEEWQTVPAIIGLHRELCEAEVRRAATLVWNANNTFGFETIDFAELARVAHITCVSKYMKFELARRGAESLVIPNGIPERIFAAVRADDVAHLRRILAGRRLLLKAGRFDPDKGWIQAIEAVAHLRRAGTNVQLILRGGSEPYADVVLERAAARGLAIEHVTLEAPDVAGVGDMLAASHADIVNVRSFLPDDLLYTLYACADAVLANSGREPFGLVGLEVMASGGIPICGSTGEDYVRPFQNALACDTGDPRELAMHLERLFGDPVMRSRMREQAADTARGFTWDNALRILDAKIAFMNERTGDPLATYASHA
ncbi:MAG: glycosyltransferase family 4 protein [bacterium]|nr:glycosyltransferase family 4 protein [bacterium]